MGVTSRGKPSCYLPYVLPLMGQVQGSWHYLDAPHLATRGGHHPMAGGITRLLDHPSRDVRYKQGPCVG